MIISKLDAMPNYIISVQNANKIKSRDLYRYRFDVWNGIKISIVKYDSNSNSLTDWMQNEFNAINTNAVWNIIEQKKKEKRKKNNRKEKSTLQNVYYPSPSIIQFSIWSRSEDWRLEERREKKTQHTKWWIVKIGIKNSNCKCKEPISLFGHIALSVDRYMEYEYESTWNDERKKEYSPLS